MKRIIRHVIPVDDAYHDIRIPVGQNAILHAASRSSGEVDVWSMDEENLPTRNARFRVVGTGHPILPNEHWVATCIDANGFLVWHLMEKYE